MTLSSSKVEYALIALLDLASQQEKDSLLTVSAIATSQGIPARYLDQILTILRHSGIVNSQRGAKGGYVLARPPWQITLLEIVSSLEGNNGSNKGVFSDSQTLEKTVVLDILQQAEKAYYSVLGSYTLDDLYQQRNAYKQQNPMYYI
ncbi:MAG: RrF2 family transcriptional regulator [Microcoleaceae cyanobacterium]